MQWTVRFACSRTRVSPLRSCGTPGLLEAATGQRTGALISVLGPKRLQKQAVLAPTLHPTLSRMSIGRALGLLRASGPAGA